MSWGVKPSDEKGGKFVQICYRSVALPFGRSVAWDPVTIESGPGEASAACWAVY
jgi:hypothetical protein